MSIIRDPLLFNYLIMSIYGVNAAQFLIRGYWADGCYWLSALAITATVTLGYKR